MARVAVQSTASGIAGAMDDPVTAATSAKTDLATAQTDLDTAMAALVTALGVVTYSSATHQFSGTFSTTLTGTAAHGNTAITALNTALTAVLAVGADLAPAASADIVLSWDTTKVVGVLKRMVTYMCRYAGGAA